MTSVANQATLGGRYRLERQVARGGMSEVWQATDLRLGRKIAIKLLEPALERVDFEREAGIVARLRHPNIVAVYDAGVEDGRRYIAMEWVAGQSLRQRLQGGGPISPREAASIGAGIASALASAHQQGVVHNDVKPENILLEESGEPRLSDFGVARITGATLAPGEANDLFGTLAYVAPEILQGAPGDERSDVYALGTTLYEAVSGRLPFDAASNAALAAQKLNARPRPLAERAPTAGTALAGLVDSMLAFPPADRPPAAELAAALMGSLAANSGDSAAATVSPLPAQPTRRLFSPPVSNASKQQPRGWWLMAAAGVAVVTLAGVAFARSGDDGGGNDADSTPTAPAAAAAVATATSTPTPVPATPVAGDGDDDDDDKKNDKPGGNPGRGRGR